MSDSDYKRRILEMYESEIVSFIQELNRKSGAAVQSNFRILWPEKGFAEGMNIIPVVSFSQQKQARILIAEIAFYLTDSFEIALNDIRLTFYEDLREFTEASATPAAPRPRFDSALGDLARFCEEVSRILDGLDFHGLAEMSGAGNGFPFAPLPGNSHGSAGSAYQARPVYTSSRGNPPLWGKNISFAGRNPTAKVSLSYAAPFRYHKSPTGNDFLDAAPPWYDELRQAHLTAAQEIKEKVFKRFASSYSFPEGRHSPEPAERTWERVSDFLAQHGHLEPACQKQQGGFKLNEYGVCLNFSCPLRVNLGTNDQRCKYQTLEFSAAADK